MASRLLLNVTLPAPDTNVALDVSWPVICVSIFSTCILLNLFRPAKSRYPSVNYNKEWTYWPAKFNFISNAKRLITEGFRKFKGPYSIVTDGGPLIMLPPEYIDAVNQEPNLNFQAFTELNNLANYETFRGFRSPPAGLFEEAVMKGLTRNLPKYTKPLSDQMTACLTRTWGENDEYHSVDLRKDILSWVARLSARIFNGPQLSEDEEWLRISIDYTVDNFIGVSFCKLIPWPFRCLAERFLPITRKIRSDYRAGARIIRPIINERRAEITAAQREGRTPDLPDDSIEWFRNASHGRKYDDVAIQMGLSMAAIHTTSDLLGQALINLCLHPEMLDPLRKEAVEVVRKFGWRKVMLTELRLMDSFFKETQRLKPIAMDVTLPNNTVIRKGEQMAISSHRMWSSEDYADPDVFDGERFVKRRKIPGLENKSLLVSTSPDHTAFSHGKHACPGRFFAANEVKIAMVHILLKYDIRIDNPEEAGWKEAGINMYVNPNVKASVRRRKEEIDLDQVEAEGQ